MANENTDYESLLAELRAKRDRLSAAIEVIEETLGLKPGAGSESAAAAASETPAAGLPREVADDTFLGMSAPEAAKLYLRMAKRPQTTSQIAAALRRGGVHSEAKHFTTTIYTALTRQKDEIVRLGDKWSLREWHPTYRSAKPKGANSASPEEPEKGASPSEL